MLRRKNRLLRNDKLTPEHYKELQAIVKKQIKFLQGHLKFTRRELKRKKVSARRKRNLTKRVK